MLRLFSPHSYRNFQTFLRSPFPSFGCCNEQIRPLDCRCFASEGDGGLPDDSLPEVPLGRFGSHLSEKDPERFEKFRAIIGLHESNLAFEPWTKSKHEVDKITINILQSLKWLPLDQPLKKRLTSYRISSLTRDLLGCNKQVDSFLEEMTIKEQEVVPSIPGYVSVKSS